MAGQSDLVHLEGVKEEYQYGFRDEENAIFKSEKGLNHQVVDQIADIKKEPEWMRRFRHEALDIFFSKMDADLGRRPEQHRF